MIDNFRRRYPGRPLSKAYFPSIFTETWMKTAVPSNATSGFTATGIYPFNQEAIPKDAIAPSSLSGKPIEPQQEIVEIPPSDPGNENVNSVAFHNILETPRIQRKGTRKSLNSSAILVTGKLFSPEEKAPLKEGAPVNEKNKDLCRKNIRNIRNEESQQPSYSRLG